ncbi:MAG: MerR family transcriptional regulator [Acutalibacteraceae bacterium]|nr:MerR family transcriptional regulator [Acutalibacteraceae bacterium]
MKMKIKEFAQLSDVSIRTLHYYDEIGLLKPAQVDKYTGYRFYDENSFLRMQQILFYRELDFPLKSISKILSSENYDKEKVLNEQKELLILKKERLERIISAIDGAVKGENIMTFFDNNELEQYKAEAKARWEKTDAYKEHTEKTGGYSADKWQSVTDGLNNILAKFSACMKNGETPDSVSSQNMVAELKGYITENYYTCTNEILSGLGQMYTGDERFKNNIDKNGKGTAEFISKAISIYCKNN